MNRRQTIPKHLRLTINDFNSRFLTMMLALQSRKCAFLMATLIVRSARSSASIIVSLAVSLDAVITAAA